MALPCLIAVWMLSGFYLSLGPSLAAQVLRSPDLLWGGLVILLVARDRGRGLRRVPRASAAPAAMLAGCLGLFAGAVVTLAAIETSIGASLPRRHRGGGRGLRDSHAGRLPHRERPGCSEPAGQPDCRHTSSSSYAAFSVPVVAAGVATTHFGLHRTALVYCAMSPCSPARPSGSFLSTGPRAANSAQRRAAAQEQTTK